MNLQRAILDEHPIFNPSAFYIETPMIGELRTVVSQWLWHGHTGGYIVGHSRVGKSRGISEAMAHLKTRNDEPIQAFYMAFNERDRTTITSVFRNLKRALGLTLRAREVADEMSDDILHCLADASFSNSLHYVVLVADEIQRATIQQLLAFTELYDMLIQLRVNLFVVFVANIGESDVLLKKVQDRNHEQIRGRFFINHYYYTGLRSADHLAKCLQEYDERRYSAHGLTTTETFLPTPYAEGWRLHSLAPTMWRIYREDFQQPLQLESWGMQFFTAAIKTLLVDYLPVYGVANAVEVEAMIRESIRASGLEGACIVAPT
ncbi:MAG: ATP-binding protein [Spongiibacteraceae bacterium]